jgi:hypothetical protein
MQPHAYHRDDSSVWFGWLLFYGRATDFTVHRAVAIGFTWKFDARGFAKGRV